MISQYFTRSPRFSLPDEFPTPRNPSVSVAGCFDPLAHAYRCLDFCGHRGQQHKVHLSCDESLHHHRRPGLTLTISGVGIRNNSAGTQSFMTVEQSERLAIVDSSHASGFRGGSPLIITQDAVLCTSDAGCRRLDLILNSGGLGAALATRSDFLSSRMSRPISARADSSLFI
jgi:hypothetical protein